MCQQIVEVGGSTFFETVHTHGLVKHTKLQPLGSGEVRGCSEAARETRNRGVFHQGQHLRGLSGTVLLSSSVLVKWVLVSAPRFKS